MIVTGTPPTADAPPDTAKNISFNWKKGQPIGAAVKSALTIAYPGYKITTNLNGSLIAPEDQPGIYTGVKAFAEYLFGASRSLINQPNYPGVQILFDGATIRVYDQPAANAKPKQIASVDLIGQPTWIRAPSIAFKCAMRADIQPGDMVLMPKALIANTAQAQSSLMNQKAAQQGIFLVTSVHHYGNFRQPDGYSWVTEFNALPTNVQAA
jgi:hypothetical protein